MKGKKAISYSLNKKADIYLLKVIKFKKYYRLKINVKKRIFYFNIKQATHNFVPFAAQSLDEPVPYSLPPITTKSVPLFLCL